MPDIKNIIELAKMAEVAACLGFTEDFILTGAEPGRTETIKIRLEAELIRMVRTLSPREQSELLEFAKGAGRSRGF